MATHADNDNDPLSFLTLAACLRNVLEFLQADKQQDEERKDEKDAGDRTDDYIEHRVKEIEAFERRANGVGIRPGRKRK